MIREDYVSFEIAKLLKEKGFDWECIGYYVDYEPDDVKYSMCGETNSTWEPRCCSAPTLQMAMKWLREVYSLSIEVYVTKGPSWCASIKLYDTFGNSIKQPYNDWDKTYSYEEAVEAAIKYCLKFDLI